MFKTVFLNQQIDARLRLNVAIGERTLQLLLCCEVLGIAPLHSFILIWLSRVKAPSAKNIRVTLDKNKPVLPPLIKCLRAQKKP